MHIPIVLFLIVLSRNAYKTLKENFFEFIFYAWLINLFHVFFSFIHQLYHIRHEDSLEYIIYYPKLFFDLLSSYLFWLGATTSKTLNKNSWFSRFTPKSQIYVLLFLLFFFIISIFAYRFDIITTCHIFGSFSADIHSLLMSIISFYFLYKLSLKYKIKNEIGYRYLYYGTVLYGILQFFSIICIEGKWFEHQFILFVYSFSLVFKFLMLLGMYNIFLADAKRKSETEQINIGLNKILGRTYHEITTPLKTIQTKLSDLTDEKDEALIRMNKKAQEKIDIIETNYNRLIAIVTASMKMYEDGIGSNFDPDLFPVPKSIKAGVNNINTIIEIAIVSVKDFFKENNKDFDEEMVCFNREYGKHCNIYCFQTEITQSIINILINSIDSFSNNGGIIDIRTKRFVQQSDEQVVRFVRIEITDNGPGIDKNIEPDVIFQEGFSTKPGIFRGYGMHIIKSLVEKNRGIIDVKSSHRLGESTKELKPGTIVTLVFPSFANKTT